ncbi:MAG: protein phosphatase 2C domain-containing protein [Isosphaeraceae bacterium]|nr:protein phosphatase 2C domain-containing protein [Isosphaeraceae bacterium]
MATASLSGDSTMELPCRTETPPGGRLRVEFGALTHAGNVRENNEDHFFVARLAKSMHVFESSLPGAGGTRFSDEEGYLMVVADGMGGAAAGERASALAVETVEEFVLNTFKWFLHLGYQEEHALAAELRQGLERADRSVIERAQGDPKLHGMGTTLTMAYSVAGDLFVVHAGDSRAYLYRDGELEQVTTDHTLVQVLVKGGVITPEAARHHRKRNVVTNVIGGPGPGVHAEIHKVLLREGDIVLLCSDGLTEPVDDEAIAATLARDSAPKDAARRLVDLALSRGGPDNVTVVVARYGADG